MSSDPIESVAKGATQGLLDWGLTQIKELASRFRDGKLGFIQDEKTIQVVKEQYRSGELLIYKNYIDDGELLFLLKMGLTLRRLDKEHEEDRRQRLRERIFSKYNVKGLHIAQFVENGLLNRYIGILIENISSPQKFKEDILEILENIDKHVLFVTKDYDDRKLIYETTTKVVAHSPSIFIVSGFQTAAELIRKCESKLIASLEFYELEKLSSGIKENLFFKRAA